MSMSLGTFLLILACSHGMAYYLGWCRGLVFRREHRG